MLRKTLLLIAGACLFTPPASAHLCDDVFRQAKDNLAVKVDVRDGQLRIGREASFRVHVLNTMDRDIVEIMLRVKSDEFSAEVRPSPEWRNYPHLRTAARGGKREYFNVTLRRRPGVADGTYRIELDLYSERMGQSFLSISLDEAVDALALPAAGEIAVDGAASRTEWGKAPLCTDFTVYRREGRYFVNLPPRWQTRARLLGDTESLFFLFSLQAGGEITEDVVTVYAARDGEEKPARVFLDRVRGVVEIPRETVEKDAEGVERTRETRVPTRAVEWAVGSDGATIEARIPRSLLGIEGTDAFRLNFTRNTADGEYREISYWRGNQHSYLDPMTYARIITEND